jgi:hypothetical protein
MKLSIGRGVFLLSALLVSGALAPIARGDALSGTLEFQFSGDDQIFELGSFQDCQTLSGVTLCVELDMASNAKGNYEGDAELTFTGDIEGTLTGPASGRVRGKDAGAGSTDPFDKASFKLKAGGILDSVETLLGTATNVPTTVTVGCKGQIATGFLTSSCTVVVKLEGIGSDSARDVPASGFLDGGSWALTINVNEADETHYSGVGFDSLGYNYLVKGKYSPSKDESTLTLKGLDDGSSNGAKISFKDLVSDAPSTAAGEARYKVQGYRGSADAETPE